MRAVKGGDPIKALRDVVDNSLLGRMLGLGEINKPNYREDKYYEPGEFERRDVYDADPAGLPSIDPGLIFSPAGDIEAIGSGVGQIAGGDVLGGGANVALGALSVLLPGTLPKVPIDEAVKVARSPRSRVTRTGGSKGDLPVYRRTDGFYEPVIAEMTQTGREFDRMGVGINPDVNYSIEDIGEASGRKIVRVRAEDGTSQLFYKSTGRGGKLMPDGKSTAGMWQPFGGITDARSRGLPEGWFIKGTKGHKGAEHGFQDYYGSKSFRSLSNQIDDEFALADKNKMYKGGKIVRYK